MTAFAALFLAAHGLLHASYLSPAPRTAGGPDWPFELSASWLVTRLGLPRAPVRALGVALVATTVVVFGAAALATIGWGVPHAWWSFLVVGGAAVSLVTLALYFHPWLVVGLAIDVALLVAVIGGWEVGGLVR